ncbi:MAG TPA: PDZ domain-containing protein [Thermoanaerobaculia bacterium]|nr:PDZ domain-containing protein [Thermoanaerobaculia bacterium]
MKALVLLAMLAATGAKPWLGVGLLLQDDTSGGKFLFVAAVPEGTPAAAAGLRAQDLITAIDGKKITFRDDLDLLEFLGALEPDRTLRLRVVRSGKTMDARLKVGRMPAEYEARWNATLARARAKREAAAKAGPRPPRS